MLVYYTVYCDANKKSNNTKISVYIYIYSYGKFTSLTKSNQMQ
jgi:hypothetical protein